MLRRICINYRSTNGGADRQAHVVRWLLSSVLMFYAQGAAAQQSPPPPPPVLPNPGMGANAGLAEFFSSRTPYEFWLTCMIIAFGLTVVLLLLWHLRTIVDRHAEDVGRAVVIVTVIVGTLILVTAGYSNDQIAPAFGLFGTIIGYILGRMPNRNFNGDASSDSKIRSKSSSERAESSEGESTR
jgi:hypothetical protein